MIYILVYVSLLLSGFVSRGNRSLRNQLYYVWIFGLFLFVGFRYRVGCDWGGYLAIFETSRIYETSSTTEQAFWRLNSLLHYLQLDYPYINVISSGLFFIGLHQIAKRQPDRLAILILSFPILIINLAMSGIRQAIALGVLCFAFNAFVDMSVVYFVLFTLLATTFHTSSGAFLMLTPFVRGRFSRQRIILGAIIAMPGIYYLLTSEAYEFYSRRYVGTATEAFGAPFRTGLIALTGAAFLWYLDRKWKLLYTKDYKFIKLTSYLMVAVFPFSFLSSVGGDRFGFYLAPIQYIVLARIPFLIKGPNADMFAVVPYAVGGVTLLTWAMVSSLFEACYLPYQTWF